MENFFTGFVPDMGSINYAEIIFKMAAATILGALIAFHVSTFDRTMHTSERLRIAKAQIIVCLVGALMIIVVGDNVARAFGLFGLGSFIRFRSAIKEVIDTAVIFILIVIGMAIGVGYYVHALLVTVFVYILMIILNMIKTHQEKIEDYEIKTIKNLRSGQNIDELVDPSAIRDYESEDTLTKKKVCPQCAERVKDKALVCRYCGYEFEDAEEE